MDSPSKVSQTPEVRARRMKAAVLDLGLIAVALTWGSSYVAMKIVSESVSVHEFLFLRFIVGAGLLVAVYFKKLLQVSASEVRLGCVFGFLLFVILSLEMTGVQRTTASNAGFLIAVSVILVPLFERFIGGVRKSRVVYVCCAGAIFGCALLTFRGERIELASGDLIILMAAVVRGAQIYLFGRLSAGRMICEINVTIMALLLVSALSLVVMLLSVFWYEAGFSMGDMGMKGWAIVVYLSVLGTAFAFLVQLQAARFVTSTNVAILLSTEPLFAAFFAWAILNETLTLLQLCGGVIIVMSALAGRLAEKANFIIERTG